jgi:hypothetical protein
MLLRTCQVGGWWFTFRVDGKRRVLVLADERAAWGAYWPSLTGALGLLFGLNEG